MNNYRLMIAFNKLIKKQTNKVLTEKSKNFIVNFNNQNMILRGLQRLNTNILKRHSNTSSMKQADLHYQCKGTFSALLNAIIKWKNYLIK